MRKALYTGGTCSCVSSPITGPAFPIGFGCHCATAPYVDEAKWQRWLDGPAQAGVPWAEFEGDISSKDQKNEEESRVQNILDDVRRKLREPREGVKVVSFKNLNAEDIKSFQNGLRYADPLVRDILRKQFKNSDYQLGSQRTECYQKVGIRPIIRLKDGFTSDTLAHELFHSMDLMGRLSKPMGASLLHDWIDLQAKSSSYGGIVSYLQKEYPEAFESGMMFSKTKLKEDYRGISDIINGLSLGSISLGFGHSTRYWSKSGNTEIEAWAQFGRIYYKNDPKVRKMFSQLFPYFESDAIREVGRL